ILLAWEDERRHTLKDALSDLPSLKTIGLLIGPEGGFAAEELELARRAGARFFSMGPRRLKAETAGILAVGLALYELGDL
ncbi:MAG: RNA methyltransferase, partial [Candidatus Latescibacteria bacterium]|nr:RNA methyltransferase [Candidatus Latescibacterota bacterium]